MFERKKASHSEQEKKKGGGSGHKMDLSMPDLSEFENVEGEAEEEEVKKKPEVSLFRNLYGGSGGQQTEAVGGSCGCFGG